MSGFGSLLCEYLITLNPHFGIYNLKSKFGNNRRVITVRMTNKRKLGAAPAPGYGTATGIPIVNLSVNKTKKFKQIEKSTVSKQAENSEYQKTKLHATKTNLSARQIILKDLSAAQSIVAVSFKELRGQNESLKSEIMILRQENENNKNRLSTSAKILKDAQDQFVEYRRKLKAKDDRIDEEKFRANQLEDNYHLKQEEVEKLKQDLETLQDNLILKNKEVDNLSELLQKAKIEMSKLMEASKDKTKSVNANEILLQKVKDMEDEKKTLNNNYNKILKQLTDMEIRVKAFYKPADFNKMVKEKDKLLKDKDAEFVKILKEKEKMSKQKDDVMKEKAKVDSIIASSQTDFENVQKQIDKFLLEKNKRDKELKDVKKENTKLLKENKDLLAQIRKAGFQDKGATVSLLKKENKELYSQVEKMMNSTEEHLEKIEKLQINNTNLSMELQKLHSSQAGDR